MEGIFKLHEFGETILSRDNEICVATLSIFEIRSFLGLARYYRRFIKDFSRLATPMTRLTQKEVKFEWNDSCEKAFEELKRRLNSTPIQIVPKRG